MNCFNHPKSSAVGICKSCGKGICTKCSQEVTCGIVCPQKECETNLNEMRDLTERSKKIYSIGNNNPQKKVQLLSLFFIFMGLIFCSPVAIDLYTGSDFSVQNHLFSLLMGFGFMIFGVFFEIQRRNLKLNV